MKNWKTTVAGLVVAAVYAWANSAETDPKKIAVAIAIAIFGALAKDHSN